ncbi:large subunit ribosomal protein L5, partial [Phenoliferia sp. Uapishka_3]
MASRMNVTRLARSFKQTSPSQFIRPSSSTSATTSAPVPDLAAFAAISNEVTNVSRSRLSDHYKDSLSHDLLYLLYSHPTHTANPPSPLLRSPKWSPTNPYALNRPPPRPKGNRYLVPNSAYTSAPTLPILESIVVQTMTKQALANKNNLLPLMMAFQAITGEAPQSKHPGPYGPGSGRGLVVTRSSKKSASFKIRPGAPTGVKVELRGPPMYNFLETLTEFVLPRLKTFGGIPLPPMSHPKQSPSSTSGVVAFGLPAEAMGLFPQIEVNLDQYSKTYGFNVFFVTSAKGRGAQDQARALLSGLSLPFVKR